MWGVMGVIVLLIGLSIYGAFIGAKRAQEFFNSIPVSVYWGAFLALLVVGLIVFNRLIHAGGLLLMHVGCVLILIGGMWGSQVGHNAQSRLFGIDKIKSGQMVIYEGESQNLVMVEGMGERQKLGFMVRLKDFRMEYYKPGKVIAAAKDGRTWEFDAEPGSEFDLGGDLGTVKVVKVYERFRYLMEEGRKEAVEAPSGGLNPAVEVVITDSDGSSATRYVFEQSLSHQYKQDKVTFIYHRTISDYISDLEVVEEGHVVAAKSIEVNHPLAYGGYDFYQSSYDAKAGRYTVLSVTSDTGLAAVYAGFAMLCVGAFYHFWLTGVWARLKLRSA